MEKLGRLIDLTSAQNDAHLDASNKLYLFDIGKLKPICFSAMTLPRGP